MTTYTALLIEAPLNTGPPRPHPPAHPTIQIRPMKPTDNQALDEVFHNMSATSRYLRYQQPTPRLTSYMRRALLNIDGQKHLALLAETHTPAGWRAIGIARFIATDTHHAEIATEVADDWQNQGVGHRLLHTLRQHATQLGYTNLHAHITPTNTPALALMRKTFPQTHITHQNQTP